MAPKRTLNLSERAIHLLEGQPHNQRGAIVSRALEEHLAPSAQPTADQAELESRIAALEEQVAQLILLVTNQA